MQNTIKLERICEITPKIEIETYDIGNYEKDLFLNEPNFFANDFLVHNSQHAAGVLISSEKLVDNIALIRARKRIITGWQEGSYGHELSNLGYYKYDILGLNNLQVVNDTVQLIEERHNKKIDWNKIDLNEQFVYDEVINKKDHYGIFQFESSWISKIIEGIHPDNFEELSQISSLIRPGPLRMGMHEEYIKRKRGKSLTEDEKDQYFKVKQFYLNNIRQEGEWEKYKNLENADENKNKLRKKILLEEEDLLRRNKSLMESVLKNTNLINKEFIIGEGGEFNYKKILKEIIRINEYVRIEGLDYEIPKCIEEILGPSQGIMCFSGDTLILTSEGLLPIEKIVNEKIKLNVLTLNIDKNIYEWKSVIDWFDNSIKKLIELEFENGIKIKCTKDHKIFTKNRGWVEANNLDENDEIVYNEDFFKLM